MKRYLLVILLSTAALCSRAHDRHFSKITGDTTQRTLPDGRYYADVDYYNYASQVSAGYNLKLKVKDGLVTVIFLNNGDAVHDGINNEGYMYTGGKLSVHKDKRSGKLEYTAQVSISNGTNISSYKITITKEAPDEKN